MRIMTVFGTRPEIIRLSQVIKTLDSYCEHILVHTGQNYDPRLSDIFFEELELRRPDVYLGVQSTSFASQIGQILTKVGELLADRKPDRVLILGDTNSGLTAIIAARLGIPTYHMEAGNRCFDNRVPEEINRRIIDHSSNILMPYTHRSKENLLREGIERQRIYVIGNPIYEVLNAYHEKILKSDVLSRLTLSSGQYFLVTTHRAENVDDPHRLASLFEGLKQIGLQYRQPIIVSLHPRTADVMKRHGLKVASKNIRLLEPLGLMDFVALEKHARCVITDSGTVQEECCIFSIPNVTVRDVTERSETIECGSNMLAGTEPEEIIRSVQVVLGTKSEWVCPPEYTEKHVATTVTKIVLERYRES